MSRLLEEELEHNWKEFKSNFIACYMIGAIIPMKRIDEYKYLKISYISIIMSINPNLIKKNMRILNSCFKEILYLIQRTKCHTCI